MIAIVVFVLALLDLVLRLAVAVRHCQLTAQVNELDQQIKTLEAQLDLLQRPDYFIECELDSLIRKQDRIRQKLFF